MEENTSTITGKKSKKNKAIFVATIVTLSFLGGFFIGQGSQQSPTAKISNIFGSSDVDFSMIEEVWGIINESYVDADNIDKDRVIFGAIRGMLNELDDPHTVFFTPEETESFLSGVRGRFEGVGIEISLRDDVLTVISPLRETPAERAGIRAGDRIIKIDGESTDSITIEEAVTKIRGPQGTEVILTVYRPSSERELDIPVVRDTIKVPSVEWELLDDNIAYIEITHFSEITAKDFNELAQEVLESDADSIILDLRNNAGGFLDVSLEVAGWFFEEGTLLLKEELGDGKGRTHLSRGPGSLKDFPLVVLQNEGSASAAEILSGALRDNRGIEVVGAQSFGKGSVQAFEEFPNGTSLKITVARWITPSGQYINDTGIDPTIPVEFTEEDFENERDPQKDRAVEVLLGR